MELMPHLKLSDELNIKYAILPGDPARVDRIAEQLEEVQPLAYNREYKSIEDFIKGSRFWLYRQESVDRLRVSQWKNCQELVSPMRSGSEAVGLCRQIFILVI